MIYFLVYQYNMLHQYIMLYQYNMLDQYNMLYPYNYNLIRSVKCALHLSTLVRSSRHLSLPQVLDASLLSFSSPNASRPSAVMMGRARPSAVIVECVRGFSMLLILRRLS